MNEQVRQIKEEVQRLMNDLIKERDKGIRPGYTKADADTDEACILELQNVLMFIDSLPKKKNSTQTRLL